MSQQNLELVLRLRDAVVAGEVPDFVAADHRGENASTAVTDRTYLGHQGWLEWRREMFSAFREGARMQVDEVIAEGSEYLVAITSLVGQGRVSDAPLELRWLSAFWFRDGKLIRTARFRNRHEALKAVGLEA
jgi:hypothetical protein